MIFSQLVAIAFLSYVFIKNWWLKTFLLWTTIRTAMLCNSAAFTTLLIIFIFILVYQALSDRISPKHYKIILNAICITMLVQALWMVMNYFGLWFLTLPPGAKGNIIAGLLHRGYYSAPTGLLSNYNISGALLALGLPAFFRRKWCWFVPLIWFGILIGKSLGGILPAFIITVVFVFVKFKAHRKKTILFIILGILFIFARPDVQTLAKDGDVRFQLNKEIIEHVIPLRPIVGIGVGQFKEFFPLMHKHIIKSPIANVNFQEAHNEYLQLIVEQGFISLFIVLGFLISLFRKIPRTNVAFLAILGVIVAILNSGCNFLFHTTSGMLVLLWVVILEKEKQFNL